MHGHRLEGAAIRKNKRNETYRYYRHPRRRGGSESQQCDGLGIRADRVEGVILSYMSSYHPDAETIALAADELRGRDVAGVGTRLAQLEARLRQISKQHEMGVLSGDVLAERIRVVQETQGKLQLQGHPFEIDEAVAALADFATLLRTATDAERELLYRQIFQRVTVAGKDRVAITPRDEFAPLLGAHHLRAGGGSALVAPTGDDPTVARPLIQIVVAPIRRPQTAA